jgi:hypothetical protein
MQPPFMQKSEQDTAIISKDILRKISTKKPNLTGLGFFI